MPPGGHQRDEAGREALIAQEFGQQLFAEEIFNELGIEIRYVMKLILAIEEALTHDPVNMGIPLQKVSRAVDGKHGSTRRARCAIPGQGLLHGPPDRLKGTSRNQLQKEPEEMRGAIGRLHRAAVAAGLTDRPMVAGPGPIVAADGGVGDVVHAVARLVDDHGIVVRAEVVALDRQLLGHALFLRPGILDAADLHDSFQNPPDSARPGVYWYFMDGNLSRKAMTADLESMKAAGIGDLIFLEVYVGVPRGPVGFMSPEWQELFVHAVREVERLGIEITMGSGPGWAGSGGLGLHLLQ